eukprot:2490112-Alexandrium_andersonii.AAC.1
MIDSRLARFRARASATSRRASAASWRLTLLLHRLHCPPRRMRPLPAWASAARAPAPESEMGKCGR